MPTTSRPFALPQRPAGFQSGSMLPWCLRTPTRASSLAKDLHHCAQTLPQNYGEYVVKSRSPSRRSNQRGLSGSPLTRAQCEPSNRPDYDALHNRRNSVKRPKWSFGLSKNFPKLVPKQCDSIHADLALSRASEVAANISYKRNLPDANRRNKPSVTRREILMEN